MLKQTLDYNDGLKRLAESHIIGEEGAAEALEAVPQPASTEGLVGAQLGVDGRRRRAIGKFGELFGLE